MFENETDAINDWLQHNPDIEIISTNSFANHDGWGYIILYEEIGVGNDADEID